MWFIKSKYVGEDETIIEEIESATSLIYSIYNYNRKVTKWYDIIKYISVWEDTDNYKYPYPNDKELQYIGDNELQLEIIDTILKYKNKQDGKNRSFVIEKYEE
jgi:hypothetical protein